MAHASRQERKVRRLKIERRQVYKMLDIALNQRDQARMVSMGLEKHIKSLEAKPEVPKIE